MKKISSLFLLGAICCSSLFATITPTFTSSTIYPELIGWSCFRPGSFDFAGDPDTFWSPAEILVTPLDSDPSQPWNTATIKKYKERQLDGYYETFNNWNYDETHAFYYGSNAVWTEAGLLKQAEAFHAWTDDRGFREDDTDITLTTAIGTATASNMFGDDVFPALDYVQTLTVSTGDGVAGLGAGGTGATTLESPDSESDAIARCEPSIDNFQYSARGPHGTTVPESTDPISLGERTDTMISFALTSVPAGHTVLRVTYSRKVYDTNADLSPATASVTTPLTLTGGGNATATFVLPTPSLNQKYQYVSAATEAP